jgi:hypothetical protein
VKSSKIAKIGGEIMEQTTVDIKQHEQAEYYILLRAEDR